MCRKECGEMSLLGDIEHVGSPEKMFAKIQELAIINQIDAPLVELLDANRQQALAAGAAGAGAAELMKNLANRCRDEMDKRIAKDAPEKRLLRALLRTDDDETKKTILQRAFEPKEGLALSFVEDYGKDAAKKTQEGPEVDPTKFIAACQQLIADFGNIDDNGEPLMVRINQIAAIAETVATELYGDVTSAREQQDLMWNEATTSVLRTSRPPRWRPSRRARRCPGTTTPTTASCPTASRPTRRASTSRRSAAASFFWQSSP